MPAAPPPLEARGRPAGRPGGERGAQPGRPRAQLRRPAAGGPGAAVHTRAAPYARAPRALSASLLADSDVDLDEPAPPPPKPQRPDLGLPYNASGLTPIPGCEELREELAREERRRAAVPARRPAPRRPPQLGLEPDAPPSGFERRELLLQAERAAARLAPAGPGAEAGWRAGACARWLAAEALLEALA